MARKMVLLTWRIRPGSNIEEFEDWMRSAEFPTFRKQPEVLNHTGWRVVESINGEEYFTHFELLEVASREDYDKLMSREEVLVHAGGWMEKYSFAGPDAEDMTQNWHSTYVEEIWG
jgi:hypothetical protein